MKDPSDSDRPAGGGLGRADPPGRVIKGPFADKCPAGKHAWCRCEKSSRYPYCDGSHRFVEPAAGDEPVTPVKIVLNEPATVVWCACGQTGNPPFCDGSHARS
ncbi:MAG: CDGSH iron-sulfur domain-containing protein [Planctomycetota bacterium]